MKIDFHSEAKGTNTLVSVEIDPSRVRGSRSTFGPLLHIGLQIVFDSNRLTHQPILFEGLFNWPGEGDGALIPLQSVGAGTAEFRVPLSDQQVAALERTRGGREANFELALRAIGMPDEPGRLGRYTTNHIPQLQVPRDVWKRTLDGFGVGTVRIIELPSPASNAEAPWRTAFEQLDRASQFLSDGRYGEAVATSRTVLERIVEALGIAVSVQRNAKENLGPYLTRVCEMFRKRNRDDDPFALISQLLRTAFGWASHPVHQGFDVSQRDDAIFAINLCVALYSYLVRADIQPDTRTTEGQ